MARRSTQSGVAQGFNLIPVSGVGEAAGVVNEAASDEKRSKRCRKNIQQRHLEANVYSHLACANGEVLSVHLPSLSWDLPLSGREPERTKHLKSTHKTPNGVRIQQHLKAFRSDVPEQVSLYYSVHDSCVVAVNADPTILCLATLESAILAIDGPKMKNSTTQGIRPC